MEAKFARWREVEAGTRFTAKTAMEKYARLNKKSFKGLRSEIALKPKQSDHAMSRAREVKTYLAADIDALVARLAAPDPVDPRWREVEMGARYTATMAMERYPQAQLHCRSFDGLPSKIAVKPKSGNQAARDVKTYLASDVDALVARLAAPEPVDPRWREVEAGTRFTATTAMERYPQLAKRSMRDLPSVIARKPKTGNQRTQDVKTYLAADVDELVARLAAPEPVDPRWLEVESGTRYTKKTAMKRYPQLNSSKLFADLPFEIARRPTIGKAVPCDIKTYAAADVDALAAARANKRARVQEPEPPQEEPEEEPEECPVCLDPMTGATATLVCGHLFCKDCITDWARSQATCPTCRDPLQFAP
ncbi:hypothetical protein SO694_0007009 [Aureococcus anophagefferens]|uniref:RING-type domain-containing protein n=1 Tax=Aureococcus anophagefferens TaxID=44056 RepID=A0ABR1FZH1_AURAN